MREEILTEHDTIEEEFSKAEDKFEDDESKKVEFDCSTQKKHGKLSRLLLRRIEDFQETYQARRKQSLQYHTIQEQKQRNQQHLHRF